MPIHASLSIPAATDSAAPSAAAREQHAAIAALAARHGIALSAGPEWIRWLVKADVPAGLDAHAFAALATLVRHLQGISTPGGYERSER